MSSSKQKSSIRVRVEWSACRPFTILSVTAALLFSNPIVARAQDNGGFHKLDTKYIFGFTIGSSTGDQGDKAFEPDTKADFGKRGGSYGVGQTALEYEYTLNQFMQIELGPTVSYYSIHNVPGLDDRDMGTINGFEANIRSVLIDHNWSPFAVTLALEPEFQSRDGTSGDKVVNYGLETRLEADTELVKNRLYLGFNLLYEPETTRADLGMWNSESTFGVSSALAFQIIPKVTIGADLWYLRHYDGAVFNSFTGDAVYLGPTFYWQIAPKILISAAWEVQIAGREVGVSSALDLTDFPRERARLLLEFEF
jgi:hypothetical protein